MQIRITDNCAVKENNVWQGITLDKLEKLPSSEQPNYQKIVEDLDRIANRTIQELLEGTGGLLVFPDSLQQSQDLKRDKKAQRKILSLSGDKNAPQDMRIQTGNMMGWIRSGDTQLTICSRFAQKDENDYFLFYMLAKVFSINLVNLDISHNKEDSILDLLPFVFPAMLQKALRQGLYKTYQRREYNDANIKGAINVARHLRLNVPFRGTVCYTMREHSSDNDLTQLIRHTVEYLRTQPMFHGFLTNDADIRADVSKIELATPTYNRNDRLKVINKNRKAVNHPFFTEYKNLQQLCLMILRREQIALNRNEDDKIHGILFDGAWLWEEYVAKLFDEHHLGIEHPTYPHWKDYLFTSNRQPIIPDFIKRIGKKSASFLGDTKYKRFDNDSPNDYYQMLAYMYRFSCLQCHLFYPFDPNDPDLSDVKNPQRLIVDNEQNDSSIIKIGLKIPTGNIQNFADFREEMEKAENTFLGNIP